MLDTVKINHVQHISFTQSRLTDAVSVILSELLSYEHPSKRLGVIKDGIATVDFVHFQSGEQQFFTDHEKLESFRSDLVVAEAMERLYQQLNQPDIGIRMGEM